jgi:hypothetical protein
MENWKRLDQMSLMEEAQNANTTPERLAELSKCGPQVEAVLAKNPKTPSDVLERLAHSGKALVWLTLLQNEWLPLVCFEALQKREEHAIQRALACCGNTPTQVLEKLATTKDLRVLLPLARNPKTPPNVLERFSNHGVSKIYRAALKNPSNPLYIVGVPWQRFTRSLRTFRRGMPIPVLLLDRLISSNNYWTQITAVNYSNLSPEQFERLALASSYLVRAALARRLDLPPKIIQILAKDPDPQVTNALRGNSNASASLPSLSKKRR